MVTITTIATSFLFAKLHSSNSNFNNSVMFAVPTCKNYSKIHPKSAVFLKSKTIWSHLNFAALMPSIFFLKTVNTYRTLPHNKTQCNCKENQVTVTQIKLSNEVGFL